MRESAEGSLRGTGDVRLPDTSNVWIVVPARDGILKDHGPYHEQHKHVLHVA